MNKPIRFRWLLIILYLGTVIPLLLSIGLLLYIEQRAFLYENAAEHLQELVDAVVERAGPGPPSLAMNLPLMQQVLAQQLRATGVDVLILNEDYVALPDSPRAGSLLSREHHSEARVLGVPRLLRVTTPEENRMVYLLPVRHHSGEIVGSLEASVPLAPLEEDLAALAHRVIIALSVASALALLLAPLIAGVAVRPLSRLVATARAVGEGDLDRRASLPRVVEVKELAITFNRMLDRIQASLEAQVQSSATIRRFAADASHELRSPLATVTSGIEMLSRALDHKDHAQARHIMEIMRNEVSSMTRLVDDLLLLARMESPDVGAGSVLHPVFVSPLPLLEEVYERAQLSSRGQAIRLEWPQQPLPAVWADRDALRRALNNVVENALRYTPPGKAVTLAIEPTPDGCRFIIDDEGSGMPAEQLFHIFERLYRGDSARSRESHGTGLGLAIVRAVVAAHGGQIEVSSAPGAGTTMVLWLPHFQRVFSKNSASTQNDVVSCKVKDKRYPF